MPIVALMCWTLVLGPMSSSQDVKSLTMVQLAMVVSETPRVASWCIHVSCKIVSGLHRWIWRYFHKLAFVCCLQVNIIVHCLHLCSTLNTGESVENVRGASLRLSWRWLTTALTRSPRRTSSTTFTGIGSWTPWELIPLVIYNAQIQKQLIIIITLYHQIQSL